MDKLTKMMVGAVNKSMTESVLINQKRFKHYTSRIATGEDTWCFADNYKLLENAQMVSFTGKYEDAAQAAKTWAKEKNLKEIYLLEKAYAQPKKSKTEVLVEGTSAKKKIKDLVESTEFPHKLGDRVHLGFGAKGGAGFKGTLTAIDPEAKTVLVKSDEKAYSASGKDMGHKVYKGPMKYVSKLDEETGLDEEIKGWKNASRDISKFRSDQANAKKAVYTHSLKKDGGLSGMHDAKKTHNSVEDAEKYIEDFKKLNPGYAKRKTHAIFDNQTGKRLDEETEELSEYAKYKAAYKAKRIEDLNEGYEFPSETRLEKIEHPLSKGTVTVAGKEHKAQAFDVYHGDKKIGTVYNHRTSEDKHIPGKRYVASRKEVHRWVAEPTKNDKGTRHSTSFDSKTKDEAVKNLHMSHGIDWKYKY
jgi:hypothetical protein